MCEIKEIKISVVSPIFGCRDCLYDLYNRLIKSLSEITSDYEIIFVNDASPDKSWDVIIELANRDNKIRGINLSRNFGQHNAITAGLDHCRGDWVVVMDCDLQDQPEEIPGLYNKALEGFDIVFGLRKVRMDSYVKTIMSRFFYKIFDYFTDNKSDTQIGNFGIYSKQVISSVKSMREQTRAFPLFVRWLGFSTTFVVVEHSRRKEGKSSYNLRKLLNLGIDLIVAYSNKPLKLSIKFGFLISFIALVYGIFLILRYFIHAVPIGWTSLMVAIFFIGGLLFANVGLLGLYVGKIYDEVKNRPLYIVKESINIESELYAD